MSAVHTKAWKTRGKDEGRCRDCKNPRGAGLFCDYHVQQHRERNRKNRARKQAQRVARPFMPPPWQRDRIPTAMDFITKPFAESIPDDNVALLAACPWLAP